MKALIWIGCLFLCGFIQAVVFKGHSLGAIPSVILYGSIVALASWLSKKVDRNKYVEEDDDCDDDQADDEK